MTNDTAGMRVFGGRDDLLLAVSDRHGPIVELDEAAPGAEADLTETVHRIYRLLAEAFTREPRVAPAMLTEDWPVRPPPPCGHTYNTSSRAWPDWPVARGRGRR